MPTDNYFTIQQTANLLSISEDTIRRWDKKGLVQSIRNEHNYRLFSVEEIKRLQNKYISPDNSQENRYKILQSEAKTNITAIELFAGAGGLALGLKHAGINSQLLVEIDNYACETLKSNMPLWNIVHDDISNIDFSSFYNKIDVVTGGFPCQAFSYAGNSLGFEDIRGTLFFEFARCIKEVNPKIAVGENVRGLLNHDNGRTLKTMITVLNNLGYRVEYRVLKAQFLDVPQKRERLIILAIRNDLNIKHIFPKEKNYTISLGEALADCPKSEGTTYPKKKHDVLKLVPQGGYWRDLPDELQREYMGKSYFLTGGKTGMARRLSMDEPSLTLTCSPAQKQTERCHPLETRPLNIREYARIQTFPDNWEFAGGITAQYKQIGNAVPVNVGYYIGRCLDAMLNAEKFDQEIMEKIEPEINLFNQMLV
jgi:DNA (cytosine-5)-methyltransferase 1